MVSFSQFLVKGRGECSREAALSLFMVPITPEVLVAFPKKRLG